MDARRLALSRRSLLAGAAGAVLASGAHRAFAGPRARPYLAQGLGGEITVSFTETNAKLAPYVAKTVAALRDQHPNATVKVDAQKVTGGQFLTRLVLAMQSGEGPDVFHITGGAIGTFAASGWLLPIDDYVAAWPDWTQYQQAVRDSITFDGRLWGLPYSLDAHFLYARRDLLEQAGLPRDWQPANVAAILDAATTIKERVPDAIPYVLYAGQNAGTGTPVRGFTPLLWAYGGDFQTPAGKWIIDSPAIRDTLRYYERAYQTDQVVPQQVVTTPNTQDVMREQFGKGRAALTFEGCWSYGPWAAADLEAAQRDIGYTLFPTRDGGPALTVGGPGNMWFINAKSKAKDLAWEFLATWNSAETVAELALLDPHVPARDDATALVLAQGATFIADAAEALKVAKYIPANPKYQDLVGVLQDVTGSVATGALDAEQAVEEYGANLTRILGAENVESVASGG